MCFGIRISSPFHLATLILPIENHKCPKNAKNACADALISPHWWWPGFQLINHFSGEESFKSMNFHLTSWTGGVPCLCWGGSTLLYTLIEVTWRSETIVMSFDENKPISASAHAFLAFLGHLLFSMGNIKVARWNGLKILIPKHMWKSKIRLLEQKLDKNCYVTFF